MGKINIDTTATVAAGRGSYAPGPTTSIQEAERTATANLAARRSELEAATAAEQDAIARRKAAIEADEPDATITKILKEIAQCRDARETAEERLAVAEKRFAEASAAAEEAAKAEALDEAAELEEAARATILKGHIAFAETMLDLLSFIADANERHASLMRKAGKEASRPLDALCRERPWGAEMPIGSKVVERQPGRLDIRQQPYMVLVKTYLPMIPGYWTSTSLGRDLVIPGLGAGHPLIFDGSKHPSPTRAVIAEARAELEIQKSEMLNRERAPRDRQARSDESPYTGGSQTLSSTVERVSVPQELAMRRRAPRNQEAQAEAGSYFDPPLTHTTGGKPRAEPEFESGETGEVEHALRDWTPGSDEGPYTA